LIHWPDVGIKHYELEQNDFSPPTNYDVNEFLKVLALNMPLGKVYVHCKAGVDRTGFMIAVYRMQVEDWPFDKAWKEMKKEGSHWWYRWWKYELKKYEVKK
jgi:protein-tyrosine phosphatase